MVSLRYLSPNVFYQTNPSPWHTIRLNRGIILLNLNFQTIKFIIKLKIATIFIIIIIFNQHLNATFTQSGSIKFLTKKRLQDHLSARVILITTGHEMHLGS